MITFQNITIGSMSVDVDKSVLTQLIAGIGAQVQGNSTPSASGRILPAEDVEAAPVKKMAAATEAPPAKRTRAKKEEEEEAPAPKRTRSFEDEEEAQPKKHRVVEEEEQPAPKKTRNFEDEEEAPKRKRQVEDEEEYVPKKRARYEDE